MNKFNPQKSSVVRTYDEARAAETKGAGLYYRGKALEYTATALLIVGIVAIVALGAAAKRKQQQQAQRPVVVEQPTVTRCNPNYIDLSVTRTERKGVSVIFIPATRTLNRIRRRLFPYINSLFRGRYVETRSPNHGRRGSRALDFQ